MKTKNKTNEISLGDRMKEFYENIFRFKLPHKSYFLIRVDGKAFKTYTKGFQKPFDNHLIDTMNETCKYLCTKIQGAKLGFVQSDEISILLTDLDDIKTSLWFDGNIQKICSVSASLATGQFNSLINKTEIAFFDARIMCIPSKEEVVNYFIWRQEDATRNSIQSVARAYCSHKECDNLNCNKLQELVFQKHRINWNDYDDGLKRGRCVIKVDKGWNIINAPHFKTERDFILTKLP